MIEPKINAIINKWNYNSALDMIVETLVVEGLNQNTLAAEQGMSEKKIKSDIFFNVVKGQYFPSDQSKLMHLVNVYVIKEDTQDDDFKNITQEWIISFDLYTARKVAKSTVDGVTTYTNASTGADTRMDYLHDQISTILEAQSNYWKSSFDFVDSVRRVQSNGWIKYVRNADDDGISLPYCFGRLQYALRINQSKLVNEEAREISEYSFTLDLEDKFVQEILIQNPQGE